MRQDREDDGFHPDMPLVEAGAYLIAYLFEVGPMSGSGQITHEALSAWQESIGIELQPWEVRFLRSLSGDYLRETFKAAKLNCPAPSPEHVPGQLVSWKSVQKSLRALANS